MSEPPIVVEGVSKRYELGASHDTALKQRMETMVRAPTRRLLGRRPPPEPESQEFWAVRDVSFEVQPGEVLGLIGANGAGKSTLLKLLSRITLPTEGRITMRGRVGSLLEVGTGFHPELTGRENVFLNGAILGMRRHEIASVYDEIVEFAGIERFIDTPVKRYSSGMYVRLAFAVAAHLRTDVLLIDEVLSVGDIEFQRKSLGKMDAAAHQGRTVVFVSHGMGAVQRLCHRALWIEKSRVASSGAVTDVIGDYLKQFGRRQVQGSAEITDDSLRQGSGEARLLRVSMLDSSGRATDRIQVGDRISLSLELELRDSIEAATTELGISSADGARVITAHNTDHGGRPLSLERGRYEVMVELDAELLPGEFTVDFGIHSPGGLSYDYVERILTFRAVNPAAGENRYPWEAVRGSVRAGSAWSVVPAAVEAGPAKTPAR
jgi:lipopolysaccharide transport system ATP-binding protein